MLFMSVRYNLLMLVLAEDGCNCEAILSINYEGPSAFAIDTISKSCAGNDKIETVTKI